MNRQIERKERKMVALFVDLKAAFDSVDRRILMEAMRGKRNKRGVDKENRKVARRDEK